MEVVEPLLFFMDTIMTSTTTQKHVIIASPCYNEEEGIEAFIRAIQIEAGKLEAAGMRVTILIIDDGSTDRVLEILHEHADKDSRIQVAAFSRNFGHQAAVAAAIEIADGDALIILDADLQHPPEHISEMVELWESGYDIVSMVRKTTASQSILKTFTSRLFYKIFNNLSETRVPDGAADFFLLSQDAHNALKAMPEYHHFWRGMISWIGFRRCYIEFSAPERFRGKSKYTPTKMLRMAFDGMTSFSIRPIQIIIGAGALTVIAGGLYLFYVLFVTAFLKNTVPGWSSLMASLLIIGGVQILTIGIIGAYIAKVFEQVKARPRYLIARSRSRIALDLWKD